MNKKKRDNIDLNRLLMEVSQNGQVILQYGSFGITDHAEGNVKSTHVIIFVHFATLIQNHNNLP